MSTSKIQTGLRLSEPLYSKLRVLAAHESRSLNNLMEYVLQKYLSDYEATHGTIEVPDEE